MCFVRGARAPVLSLVFSLAAALVAGCAIIATIGDQESDLAGGHAERAFKLPNPFYRIL